jgi:hypothetical protein
MYRSLLVAVVATLVITWVAGMLFADRDRGALLALAAVAAVILGRIPAVGALIGLAWVLLVVDGLVNRRRMQRLPAAVPRLLSVFAIALLAVTSINAIQNGAIALGMDDIARDLAGRPPATRESNGEAFPDIVLVMLDGYPGDDAAQLVPTFDVDAFPDALAAMSFDVQRNSRSNYLYTPSTLASMLEMRHLLDVERLAPWDAESLDDDRLRQVMNTGAALQVLHDHGYELIAINAGYADTEIRAVDRWIETGQPTEFEIALIQRTALGSALEIVAPDLLSGFQRARIRDAFATVEAVVAEASDRPRLLIAHVPAPHAPWVFDSQGRETRDPIASFFSDAPGARGVDRAGALKRVFDQAAYVGTLAAQSLERLIGAGGPTPVVVVFSDHGPGTGFNSETPWRRTSTSGAATSWPR